MRLSGGPVILLAVPFVKHVAVSFAMVLAFLALTSAGQAATTQAQAENSLLAAVNDVRAAHDLRPLQVDEPLVEAARDHTTKLLRQNIFEHGSFADRIANCGARGPAFGENLAWGVGDLTSTQSIVSAWMASPVHRANLLRPGWSRIGIGALSGRFRGYSRALVITADFAGR